MVLFEIAMSWAICSALAVSELAAIISLSWAAVLGCVRVLSLADNAFPAFDNVT
ncbi:hypothetical protein MnBA_17290 [Marinobacterium sp. BA1]